jgi:hypothetical protein
VGTAAAASASPLQAFRSAPWRDRPALLGVPSQTDWSAVAAVFELPPKVQDGDVLDLELPRADLQPSMMGVSIDPGIGFDSHITFVATSNGALAKWELALLESEVEAVLDAILGQAALLPGEPLSALHNHHLGEQPRTLFVHGAAQGDPLMLATILRGALAATATPLGTRSTPGMTGLDNQAIAAAIGGQAEVSGTNLTVTVARCESITQFGVTLPPAMQVNSMVDMQALGGGQAAAMAEIVVLPSEAPAVASVLRAAGFAVSALHNHELQIEPRIFFLHTFGTGDPLQMAGALGQAIAQTNSGCR